MATQRRARPAQPGTDSGTAPATREAAIVEQIKAIPEGFVRTYGDVYPSAPRIVGRILATTNESLPWHRVVRSDGTVAKGTRQLTLLRREGVPLLGDRVDLKKARLPH
jgi:alkylated DNA nucleotide flippase Atl1